MDEKTFIDDCTIQITLSENNKRLGIVCIKTNGKGKIVYKMKDNTYHITETKSPMFKTNMRLYA